MEPNTLELVDPEHHSEPAQGVERTLTISEAARVTGMSRKAVERRVERGTLRSVLDAEGLRRIPTSELVRLGLVPHAGPLPPPAPGEQHAQAGPLPANSVISATQLLERIERLTAENAQLRQLEERAGSLTRELDAERQARERIEAELHQQRARAAQQEAQAAQEHARAAEHQALAERHAAQLAAWESMGLLARLLGRRPPPLQGP